MVSVNVSFHDLTIPCPQDTGHHCGCVHCLLKMLKISVGANFPFAPCASESLLGLMMHLGQEHCKPTHASPSLLQQSSLKLGIPLQGAVCMVAFRSASSSWGPWLHSCLTTK